MSNAVRRVLNPVVIEVAEDLMIFDAFSLRVRAAFNYAPVKLAATPRALLLDDERILAMIEEVSAELVRDNPTIAKTQNEISESRLTGGQK